MSLEATVYDGQTGLWKNQLVVPDMANLEVNLDAGDIWKPGHYSEDTILVDGEVQELPPRPNDRCRWRDGEWVTCPQKLYVARLGASRNKSELLFELAQPPHNILTLTEALQAARGEIPASFQDAFSSLDVETQAYVQIKLAGETTIGRLNPLLQVVAYLHDVSDETLDEIFGIN